MVGISFGDSRVFRSDILSQREPGQGSRYYREIYDTDSYCEYCTAVSCMSVFG